MDIKHVKEFESFITQIQPQVAKIEKKYNEQASAVQQNCFNHANNQENKFVECMLKRSESYEKQFKRLEFYISYWKNNTYKCFQNNPSDLQSCKSDALETLQTYIDKCLNNI